MQYVKSVKAMRRYLVVFAGNALGETPKYVVRNCEEVRITIINGIRSELSWILN